MNVCMSEWNEGYQSLRHASVSIGSNLHRLRNRTSGLSGTTGVRSPGKLASLLAVVWPPCGSIVVAVVDTQIAGRASSRRGVAHVQPGAVTHRPAEI